MRALFLGLFFCNSVLAFSVGCATSAKRAGALPPPPPSASASANVSSKNQAAPVASVTSAPDPIFVHKPELNVSTLDAGDAEFAEFLGEIEQSTQTPADLHGDFEKMIVKREEMVREQMKQRRKTYADQEASARREFLERQRLQREKNLGEKHDPRSRAEFFAAIAKAKQAYLQGEHRAHVKFEADLVRQQRVFEAKMHAHRKTFNEAYRAFAKKAADKPRAEKAVTGDEFRQLDKVPARPLGTED